MGKKMTVEVTVVPTEGDSQTKTVSVKKSGASVKEILAAAKITAKKVDVLINGKPAKMETHVSAEDQLKVSERPQGS